MRDPALAIACSTALAVSCAPSSTFICQSDGQCRDGDRMGTCEAEGYCSFPDPECESDRRYGELAPPELANACVPDEVSSTTDTSTSTGESDDPSTTTTSSEVSSSDDGSIPADWWDTAWSHRVAITVAYDGSTDDLVAVPLLAALTGDRIDASVASTDGRDVRFVAADGATVLPHEIDTWTNDARIVWVLVPTIQNGDALWLYYGNPDAPDTSTEAVWGDHVIVFHMGSEIADASGTLGDLSIEATAGPGRLGDATAIGNAPIVLGDLEPVRDLFFAGATVSAWIHPTGWGVGDNWGRIVDKMDLPSDGNGYSLMVEAAGRFRFVHGFVPAESGWETPASTLALDEWTWVSITYQAIDVATPPAMYIDGVARSLTQNSMGDGEPLGDAGVPFALGGRAGTEPRTFQGSIDELRIETVQRPAQWHALQHASMSDALLEWGGTETIR